MLPFSYSRNGSSLRGFTLVELLIVIAILAVLSAAVVVVLNPGELLAQARDSQRLNDLDAIKSALSIYVAQVNPIALGSCPGGGRCTYDPGAGSGPFLTTTCTFNASTNNVTGTGWVDVDFSDIPGGSPIPFLPNDPTDSATYFYGYACDTTYKTFKLVGRLESVKHRDKMKTDGGSRSACTSYTGNDCFYEIGTDPGLDL